MISSIKTFLKTPVSLRGPSRRAPRGAGRGRLALGRKVAGPHPAGRQAGGLARRIGRVQKRLDAVSLRRSPRRGRRRSFQLQLPGKTPRPSSAFKLSSGGLRLPGLRGGARKPDPRSMAKIGPAALVRRSRPGGFGRRADTDVVGLDIQPGFIAAVEASVNGSIRAVRAATAPLEGDVVPEGEVADEQALSDSLRELFDGSGLGRRVRVGVANQRTVLRILEMPPLSDAKELAAAVRFQAQDQVPMPLSNAVLDFHPLGLIDTPSGPRQRVALVAAQRDMIERLVAAVRGAGLRPVGVDLSAFALIRALFHPDAEHAGRVLYLNVDGLTNLAIAEGTSCRFNRVVGVGLEGVAEELAKRTGVARADARSLLAAVDLRTPPAEAQPLPGVEEHGYGPEEPDPAFDPPLSDHQPTAAYDDPVVNDAREVREVARSFAQTPAPAPLADTSRAPSAREVRAALEDGIRELIGEVRNTLDFHASQDGGGDVSHVVLSGQALNVQGFAEALQVGLGMEVHGESVALLNEAAGQTVSAGRLAVAAGLATVEAPR